MLHTKKSNCLKVLCILNTVFVFVILQLVLFKQMLHTNKSYCSKVLCILNIVFVIVIVQLVSGSFSDKAYYVWHMLGLHEGGGSLDSRCPSQIFDVVVVVCVVVVMIGSCSSLDEVQYVQVVRWAWMRRRLCGQSPLPNLPHPLVYQSSQICPVYKVGCL